MKFDYALMNPIQKFLKKEKTEFTRDDMVAVVENFDIERITFHYTALDGKLKELKLPFVNRDQLVRILVDGERVDGSSLYKGMVSVGNSDLYVVPVYRTAFLSPFEEGSLDFICRFIQNDGQLAPFTLDNILGRANEKFEADSNLELHALGELEFFLISENNEPLYKAQSQKGYHNSSPFIKSTEVLNEILRTVTSLTGSVKYAHSEVGLIPAVRSNDSEIAGKLCEQVEVEFLPTPVLEAADNLVLSRWLVRNIAYQHGYIATFLPKIEEGVAGNGMHIHMALMENGKNIMRQDANNLSAKAKMLIGGLAKFAGSLNAFGNTVASAYLRLVPNQEAPTDICWSDSNRSAMIRVPLSWSAASDLASIVNPNQAKFEDELDGRQTVELRTPDGSANIYLLLAGIIIAANWGLQNEVSQAIANDVYIKGNIHNPANPKHELPILPRSCVESAKILDKYRSLFEAEDIFPDSLIDFIIKQLRAENDEEMNHFLADLPADDRLLETRKLMHRDLHRH